MGWRGGLVGRDCWGGAGDVSINNARCGSQVVGEERLITPIWDVLAPQGEQERALNRLSMRSRSPYFQIRQRCQLASLLSFALGFVGVCFSQKCIHIQLGTWYLYTINVFLNVWAGGNGWMVLDGFGRRIPN